MPYKVEKSDSCPKSHPWAVIKETDGEVLGCHSTKQDAEKQQKALYSSEENTMDLKKLNSLANDLRNAADTVKKNSGKNWYSIKNASANSTYIGIYDMIGEYGVNARDFIDELKAISTKNIDLHINSEGGQVFDGLAIYAALKNHPANVTITVDALAASAASFIVQAADTRVMEPNSRMMIHDAAGIVMGNAVDARKLADMLDDASNNIASIYAERSGRMPDEFRKAMQDETWYTAQDAVDAGLADSIAGSPTNSINTNVSNKGTITNNEKSAIGWDFDILEIIKEIMK